MTRLDEKQKFSRNFAKIFKKSLQNIAKMHYFSIFFKKVNKPMRSFFAVWTKNTNCWEILRKFWKFLMKIQLKNWILLWFLENLLLKIEPSEITPFFYNNFFGFEGGGDFPPPMISHYKLQIWSLIVAKLSRLIINYQLSRSVFPSLSYID